MDLESNRKYASLTIASGALIEQKLRGAEYFSEDLRYIPVALRPFPDSILANYTNSIIEKYWDHTERLFPLYDGKTLPHHLTVRSTVINVTVMNYTR